MAKGEKGIFSCNFLANFSQIPLFLSLFNLWFQQPEAH